MTSFSLSARLFCISTAPAKGKMLIGVNNFGEKTEVRKIKHALCHGLGADFFLRDFHFSAYLGLCTWL